MKLGMQSAFVAGALMLALPSAGWSATYRANLTQLNNSGVGGFVTFAVDSVANLLNVSARITGLTPSSVHVNHIHGRFNPDGTPMNSVLPTAALDADGDGFVEVLEAAPAYGDILLSLEPALAVPSSDPSMVHTGPMADASGNLSYDLSFDLTNDSIFFDPIDGTQYTADDIMPLFLREYVVHGMNVPSGVISANADAGYLATLPVAAAEISAVPVPAGGLLLVGGLGLFGALRKRRHSA